jgi:hypothetical protein
VALRAALVVGSRTPLTLNLYLERFKSSFGLILRETVGLVYMHA